MLLFRLLFIILFFSTGVYANQLAWHDSSESIFGWSDDGYDKHIGVTVYYSHGKYPFKEIEPPSSIGFLCEFYPMNETNRMTMYLFVSVENHAFKWHGGKVNVTFTNGDETVIAVGMVEYAEVLKIPYSSEVAKMIRKDTKVAIAGVADHQVITIDYDKSNKIFQCINGK
jgi:hypothetical protein